VTSAADEASNSSPNAVPSQSVTSSNTVSADGNDTVAPSDSCEANIGHQTTGEDTKSVPADASEINNALSATKATSSSSGPVRRKRGRPPLHSQQAAERRHQKLLDVCNTAFLRCFHTVGCVTGRVFGHEKI